MRKKAINYLMSLASKFALDSMSNRQNSIAPLSDARCSTVLSLQKQISNGSKNKTSLILEVSSINVCVCCKKQPKHFDSIVLNAEMEGSFLAANIQQREVIFKSRFNMYILKTT